MRRVRMRGNELSDDRPREMRQGMDEHGAETSRWKWWSALAIVVIGLIVIGLAYWLYQLGGEDQSPLERIRDIVIIFLAFQLLLVTIVLAGIAAGLAYLVVVLKDQVIPLLTELTETARRLRGTTEFVTEEAVKPIVTAAGQVAKMRAMMRAVTGQDREEIVGDRVIGCGLWVILEDWDPEAIYWLNVWRMKSLTPAGPRKWSQIRPRPGSSTISMWKNEQHRRSAAANSISFAGQSAASAKR